MTMLTKIQMEKNRMQKYQSSFMQYKRCQNYYTAQSPWTK